MGQVGLPGGAGEQPFPVFSPFHRLLERDQGWWHTAQPVVLGDSLEPPPWPGNGHICPSHLQLSLPPAYPEFSFLLS